MIHPFEPAHPAIPSRPTPRDDHDDEATSWPAALALLVPGPPAQIVIHWISLIHKLVDIVQIHTYINQVKPWRHAKIFQGWGGYHAREDAFEVLRTLELNKYFREVVLVASR